MNDPAPGDLAPDAYLSRNSRLIDLALSGEHHDVKVDPIGLRRLIAWVDACCPFWASRKSARSTIRNLRASPCCRSGPA